MNLAHRGLDLALRDTVRYGRGRIAELPDAVRGARASRAFVVTDPAVAHSGVAERVRAILETAGIAAHVYLGEDPNPATASILRGSRALALFGTARTAVVALGGASAVASARAISLHALNGGDVVALGRRRADLFPGLPVIAVPTVGDAAGETVDAGPIVDEHTGRGVMVGHRSVLPPVSILDPALAVDVTPAATAAAGVDTLAHALESLLSATPNPFAEAMADETIRTIGAWLPVAVDDGTSVEARGRLLLAAHLAGLGEGSGSGPGPALAIGVALARRAGVARGVGLAAVLPGVLALDLGRPGGGDRELALAGVALGVASPADDWADAAAAAIGGVEALLDRIGLRPTLAGLGVGEDAIAEIVADALDSPELAGGRVVPSGPDIEAILRAAAS